MFPRGNSFRSYNLWEERDLYTLDLHKDENINRYPAEGKMSAQLPSAPPGHPLPRGVAPPQSAQVQVLTRGGVHPRVQHLTTQPSGCISPLAFLSGAGREIINSPFEATKETVDRARSCPFVWRDRMTLDPADRNSIAFQTYLSAQSPIL